MSSKFMKIDDSNQESQFEYLYPHGFECMSILVPSIRQRTNFILMVFRNETTILILITFFMFVVARIIIESTSTSGWFSEFMLTLEICLAQKFIKSPKSTREFIWVIGLLLFALISVVILASISYKSLVEKLYESEIDTLEQLANSELNIFMTRDQPDWTDGRYDTKAQNLFSTSSKYLL